MAAKFAEGVKSRPDQAALFTQAAVDFLTALHRKFEQQRQTLLLVRKGNQRFLDRGYEQVYPKFRPDTAHIRRAVWRVSQPPVDLQTRQVEITGPAEAKMIINALNSGADVFMADFEDALSPTWNNVVAGQLALRQAVRGTLTFTAADRKQYKLNEKVATLMVRPRGLHLTESHFLVDGQPMSASLFDFGMYFIHNHKDLVDRCSGAYFYLPKLEGRDEAGFWAAVFRFSEDWLGQRRGSICATVLIENWLAAFQMEEILF